MTFLSASDKARIAAAIRQVERKTCGELVTVIAPAASGYELFPLLWAAAVALVAPALLLFLPSALSFPELYAGQLLIFFILAFALRLPALKMRLVPRAVKQARAARYAREQFYAQGLHRTREGTGVLIFVAVAERYVEILADHGIDARVAPDTWQHIVGEFVTAVRARRIAEGFLAAVAACGEILQRNFPADKDDTDELPNHLIEL